MLDTQAGPPSASSRALLDRVLTGLAGGRPDARVHSCVGNHCLAAVGRTHLNARLGVPPPPAAGDHSYYEDRLGPGWRLIVLDGYDVSLLGWPATDPRHAAASTLLASRNPNPNKNAADGLVGVDRRFVAFGGGVGEEQLAWLESALARAASAGTATPYTRALRMAAAWMSDAWAGSAASNTSGVGKRLGGDQKRAPVDVTASSGNVCVSCATRSWNRS